MKVQGIIEMIDIERENQLLKWGEQEHDDLFWLAILGEEYGESAAAILQGRAPQTLSEVVQCAAVCVAWLEDWYRSCPDTLRDCKKIIESRLAETRASKAARGGEDTPPVQADEQVAEPDQLICHCKEPVRAKKLVWPYCARCDKPLAG